MSCGQGVEPTRSKAYRKNDQVRIGQKNGAVIRRFVGYERYAGPRVRSSLPASWGWPSRLKLSSRCEATRPHIVIFAEQGAWRDVSLGASFSLGRVLHRGVDACGS